MSLKRTDLALWSLDARRRTDHLPARRGEVLQRAAGNGRLRAAQGADRRAAGQAARRSSLRGSTRPTTWRTGRTATVRNAELGQLLRFYLGRAVRHGTMRAGCGGRGRMAAGKPRPRQVPAAVHPDRPHLRPVRARGRAPRPTAGSSITGSGANLIEELLEAMPTDAVLAAEAAAMSTSPTMSTAGRHRCHELAEAAFRAPDRRSRDP